MADPKWRELEVFNEKLSAYLESHRGVVGDFERSLGNARHYIELAKVAKDKEPENTLTMLKQIGEINLLGHVQQQYEAFQDSTGLLIEPEREEETEEEEDSGEMDLLRERYELLLEEAEDQQETMEELMLYLQKMA